MNDQYTEPAGRSDSLEADERVVAIGSTADPEQLDQYRSAGFADNAYRTSKYTTWNFVPRSLFGQFRRFANVYFLVISVMMLIGTYAPRVFSTPLRAETTLGPLMLVLALTMLKEAMEDHKRHLADRHTNEQPARVVQRDGGIATARWRDLRVGDIVEIRDRESLPADVVLLATAQGDGSCRVETRNIDGESDLKLREVPPRLQWLTDGDDSVLHARPDSAVVRARLAEARGELRCEKPSPLLHAFAGTLRLHSPVTEAGAQETIAVTPASLVLYGSVLRATPWAIGVVAFTGADTKLMLKSSQRPTKMSHVERMTNVCIALVLLAQCGLCACSAALAVAWDSTHVRADGGSVPWYLRIEEGYSQDLPQGLASFLEFFILYGNFIPISLYVTIEFVNLLQALLIDNDRAMYDAATDTPARARSTNMASDLGQVEIVFADKTGTFTRNEMVLRACAIGEHRFRIGSACARKDVCDSSARVLYDVPALTGAQSNPPAAVGAVRARPDERTQEDLTAVLRGSRGADADSELSTMSRRFFECLTLCHTVVVERHADASDADARLGLQYEAESADESALVSAACALGVMYTGREAGRAHVHWMAAAVSAPASTSCASTSPGGDETCSYDVLALNSFNSARKRMSVLVRAVHGATAPANSFMLFCKGADTHVLPRCNVAVAQRGKVEDQLRDFSRCGYRTLVLAWRPLSEAEACDWLRRYEAAAASISQRDEKLAELADVVERDLCVLGVTAVEDRLQDGVPETIRDLRQAGIQVWMVTGDKEETAVDIARSSALLDEQHDMLYLRGSERRSELEARLDEAATNHENESAASSAVDALAGRHGNQFSGADAPLIDKRPESADAAATAAARGLAMVVDGDALARVLQPVAVAPDADQTTAAASSSGMTVLAAKWACVARRCSAVIVCRAMPQQKAAVVRTMKCAAASASQSQSAPLTLAIGDGANDVGMIEAASVGVGISGREGVQAANASDYSIAQFRFLKRLLLVHGHWDYIRLSKVVQYSLYKNIVLTLCIFYFQFWCGFSGQTLVESLVYAGYNFFLGLPIIGVGVFDRDYPEAVLMEHTALYSNCVARPQFGVKTLFIWLGTAFVHSIFVFGAPFAIQSLACGIWGHPRGAPGGLFFYGLATYTTLIFAMQFAVAQLTATWTWVTHFLLWASVFGYVAFVCVYCSLTYSQHLWGVAAEVLPAGVVYAVSALVLCTIFCFAALVHLCSCFYHHYLSDCGAGIV